MGTLGSGQVVVDRPKSHLAPHLKHNQSLLREALSRIEVVEETIVEQTVRFEEEVGQSICVATTDTDDIVYAQRPNRAGYTRFVKNRKPEAAHELTVVLKRDDTAAYPQYLLVTAFIGPSAGPEPWDERVTNESKQFWQEHALIWGETPVIAGTETAECPW